MIQPLGERLRRSVQTVTPAVTTLALILLSVVPLEIPYFTRITPLLALTAVYYWGVYRPTLMPVVLVFLLGLLQDLLGGGIIGLTALVFVVVRQLSVSQRRVLASNPFVVGWAGFALVAIGAEVFRWAISCAFFERLLSLGPVATSVALTVSLYPLFAWIFGRIEQRVMGHY